MIAVIRMNLMEKPDLLHIDYGFEEAKHFVNVTKPKGDIRFFEMLDINPKNSCMTCTHRSRKGIESFPECATACWKIADEEGSDHRAFFEDGNLHVCQYYE